MARSIWVIAEVADGKLSRITTEVATAARGIAEQAGRDVVGVVVGADPGKPAEELARFVPRVLSVADPVTDGHASATLLAERVAALAAASPCVKSAKISIRATVRNKSNAIAPARAPIVPKSRA